ncbi:hypothetical protein VPH35_057019 [Triticum aestivum]|uniref:DUF6598 domain-containing protein n=1 Tax=Triticum turgidum subsp. durum TaxID=4567 RepID=A0A9R1R059_TRITD|nr:unnamed protein product [Triticum turgidum subsp. durum]
MAASSSPVSARRTQDVIGVHMTFNLKHGDYAQFIRDFCGVLVKHETPEMVAGHLVLAKQNHPAAPKRWMYIKLKGKKNESVTLAIRDDNLYLIGFQGKNERWYEFGISTDVTASILNTNTPTTFLGCDVTYKELLEVHQRQQVRTEMGTLELGRRSAIEAVRVLSRYEQVDNVAVDRVTRRALVRLIHMFCEATRMIPFFNTVVDSWDNTTGGHRIREDQVIYLWHWGRMLAALREWKEKNYGSWGEAAFTAQLAKQTNVKSAGEALDVVQLLLRKAGQNNRSPHTKVQETEDNNGGNDQTGGKEQAGDGENMNSSHEQAGDSHEQTGDGHRQTGDSNNEKHKSAAGYDDNINQLHPASTGFGRPLVQVFGVRADFHVVGSIAVFDGKRGQIIYKCPAPIADYPSTSENTIDLPLTGPYRAISADGSFVIQVQGSERSKNVGGDMLWDCYSDQAVYDKVLTHNIGSIADVTYAVLSNAVETSVQVQLKLNGDKAGATARVHGEITAKYQHYNDHSIVLFSCTKEKEMELEISMYDGIISIPIPLQRSVIAVPVSSSLQIKVKIHVTCLPKHEGVVSFDDDLIFPHTDQQTGKLLGGDVAVHVTIRPPTSADTCAFPKPSNRALSLALATTPVPRKETTAGKSLMRWVLKFKRLMPPALKRFTFEAIGSK